MDTNIEERKESRLHTLEYLALLFLFFYPLRHVFIGGDFQDTAYNFTNFEYMGTEHMDSMWLFSTYLATAVGHFMTLLPGGHTVLGLNIYTGMIIGIISLIAYLFCCRELKMPAVVVFCGELLALSLCWCPSAVLYNYLTYLFLLLFTVFLYIGIVKDKKSLQYLSGICLGLNIFVRFSNLPEPVLLLALWIYLLFVRRDGEYRGRLKNAVVATLRIVGAYLAAAAVMLLFFGLCYGWTAYPEGIRQLLSMTDGAEDYKASSMLIYMLRSYKDGMYWFLRILFFAVLAFAVVNLGRLADRKGKGCHTLEKSGKALSAGIGAAMLFWLFHAGTFTSVQYWTHSAMVNPANILLFMILLTALLRLIFGRENPERCLLGMLCAATILISAIGSNNGLFPCYNNLFLAAPYLLWELWEAARRKEEKISFFGAKLVTVLILGLIFIQSVLFGIFYVFSEERGILSAVCQAEGNEVISGIRMGEDKAQMMEELTEALSTLDTEGKEVITMGNVPGIGFYFKLPPAFNPWPELASYSVERYKQVMNNLRNRVAGELPLVILYLPYWEKMFYEDNIEQQEVSEQEMRKAELLMKFLDSCDYQCVYRGNNFGIYNR